MEEPDEVEDIKVPLSVVWHAIQLLPALNVLVHKAHYVTTHAYTMAAWIFINEIHDDDTFDPEPFITLTFFKEVWLALTTRKRRGNVKKDTKDARTLIDKYLDVYLASADIRPVVFNNPSQTGMYEAKRMLTAYTNHVKMRFGDYLRYAINLLLDTKARTAAIKRRMADASKTAIRQACNEQVWQPARRAKEAIARRNPDLAALDGDTAASLAPLCDVLEAYPLEHMFDLDDRFIDAINYPASHVKALFKLALVLEKVKAKKHIQCFPLRTSWVPCHVHVDNEVLCTQVLNVPYDKSKSFDHYWSQVLDLDGGVCQERQGKLFWGAVRTDGVSVSVVKKTLAAKLKIPKRGKAKPDMPKTKPIKRPRKEKAKPAPKRQKTSDQGGSEGSGGQGGSEGSGGPGQPAGRRRRKRRRGRGRGRGRRRRKHRSVKRNRDVGPVRYITEVPKSELRATTAESAWRGIKRVRPRRRPRYKGRCVLIDPGRRDRLFCVHEDSTAERPLVFRHTGNQEHKDRRTTHVRRIREEAKIDFDKQQREGEWTVTAAEAELAKHQRWTLDPAKFKHFVEARAQVWDVLSKFYGAWTTAREVSPDLVSLEHTLPPPRMPGRRSETVAASSQPAAAESAGPQATTGSQPSINSSRGSLVGQRAARAQPLHRKLQLLAYIYTERANAQLVRRLRNKFGDNMVAIMGDWSAPHQPFQEPIRGKGMRAMLRRHGIPVYLINEHKTSSICSECCTGDLEKFREVDNPRKWQREKHPKVICHGLLRCKNKDPAAHKDKCGNPLKGPRYWNRDMAAALNFAHILRSVREAGLVPERFRRAQPAQN
ncbi:hypothetical protein H4R21_002510 [Coemansia helicoidea]|uniref:Uncharacterized protein n=1 Tax=Coemansia helicoidea TaxID=1286919 RepID=A0ACC1L6K7_9FUNG|nr:hypothetical protein H4R21_002510 [Coemansia helicoidea]